MRQQPQHKDNNNNNNNDHLSSDTTRTVASTLLTHFLSSRASNRAYVIASHIAPIVHSMFHSTQEASSPPLTPFNDDDDDNNNGYIQQQEEKKSATTHNNHHQIDESLRQFLSSDQVKPWLMLCEDFNSNDDDEYDNGETDQLFRRFCSLSSQSSKTSNNKTTSVDQLTQQEVLHLLKRTMQALDMKIIEPKHVPVLNLHKARLTGSRDHILLNNLIPKCSELVCVNLSHLTSVVDDETMECLGRYLPHLTSIIVDYCTNVTDDGCLRMLEWMNRRRRRRMRTGRNTHDRDAIRALQTLNLSHTGITETSLRHLLNYLMLSVSSSDDHTFDDDQSNDLSVLRCDGIDVSRETAEGFLNTCQKLNKLNCGNNDYYSRFRDRVVLKLPNLASGGNRRRSSLEIDLSGSLVTNDILKNVLSVYASPSLRKISLRDTRNIDDSVLPVIQRFLKRMPNLETIDVENTNLSDRAKHAITQLLQVK